MKNKHQILIVGGGSAGVTVSALLAQNSMSLDIAIIEPSETHYYQPLWTLVGGGVFTKENTERRTEDLIPRGVKWIKDKIAKLDPDNNRVSLESGSAIEYDYLVVAAGIQLDWDKIPGLKESLGKNGVCSNYSYNSVDYTWENIRDFGGGNAVFTQPSTPIKCGGAPQKICYLAEEHFRKIHVRHKTNVIFNTAMGGIFPSPHYAEKILKVAEAKEVEVNFQRELAEIMGEKKEAAFKDLKTGETVVVKYDMLHATPPQSAPDFIKKSPLAAKTGWLSVDKRTLQSDFYPNVFGLGDCSNLPTSKTGAAIRKQAPVMVDNLLSKIKGKNIVEEYDGYTSCPVITGYGSLIMTEFDYTLRPRESFPFDQSEERYSMYALKAYGLPMMYWHGMLKGRLDW